MSDAAEKARQVRSCFGHKLPLNIAGLVEKHGITILRREVERSVTGVLVIDATRVTMLLNRLFDESQQRFSLAHLLGHFVLHRNLSPFFVDFLRPNEKKATPQSWRRLEQEADEFADELLMPEEILRESIADKPHNMRSSNVVQPLAARFGVSELAFVLRLSQLGLMNY
jgi:Zn-dependent peptidase ImmA (M78 family)